MQALKRRKTRYSGPAFLLDDSKEKGWVCEREGQFYAYINSDQCISFRWGLWLFTRGNMPSGEELSIWSNTSAPNGISGERLGLVEMNLVTDAHAVTAFYKAGGKVRVLPGRLDLYVTLRDFRKAFLAVKTLGRRRRGKTVQSVKLFDTFWIERVPEERWPAPPMSESLVSYDPSNT